MKSRGIYVSPTEFVQFAEPRVSSKLSDHIATRDRSPDFAALGMYLPNPDPILKRQGKDISVYRDLRSDAHVGGCIRRRKAAVKGLEWRVNREKASARATKLCLDVMQRMDMDRLLNEITDATLFGWQPLEVMWEHRNGANVPADIIGKPSEWFNFNAQNELRFRSRAAPLFGEELDPRKFLLATQEASYANPYGHADLSMCFWPTVFKRGGLKFWVTFTEKFGTPWLVGKTPRGTPGAEIDKLLDQLEAMVQDAVAVIPDDSSVDTVEASDKGASADLYERLLMFCRSEVAIALLGQNQSTESNSNRASAEAGLQVAQSIRDGDARLASACIDQLFRWIVDLNEGEGAPAPKFELFEEEDVNLTQAERDETLTRAGVQFTPKYWERVYKLEPGDIVEAPAPVVPASPVAPPADPAAALPVAFAEPDLDMAHPDQVALDAALAGLPPEQLQEQMQLLLQPVFDRLKSEQDPQAMLGWLAEQFPGLDESALQERLTRLMFAAAVWGRLHGDD